MALHQSPLDLNQRRKPDSPQVTDAARSHSPGMDERKEPRYTLKAESASVLIVYSGIILRLPIKIADLSRSGLRLEGNQYRCPGSDVTVRMKELVIMGTVQYCAVTRTGWYATGMLINNVSGEPAADSRFESEPMPASSREQIAMPVTSKRDWNALITRGQREASDRARESAPGTRYAQLS